MEFGPNPVVIISEFVSINLTEKPRGWSMTLLFKSLCFRTQAIHVCLTLYQNSPEFPCRIVRISFLSSLHHTVGVFLIFFWGHNFVLKCNFFIIPIVHWIFQLVSTTAEAWENSLWITMSCGTAADMKVLCQKIWSTFPKYTSAIAFILKLEREVEIEVFLQFFSQTYVFQSPLFLPEDR